MKWIPFTHENQIQDILNASNTLAQVILKHSTRCSISIMAYKRLEKDDKNDEIPLYYIDILKYRALSDMVSNTFRVEHESPQVLVIKNRVCVCHVSHSGVRIEEIMPYLN